MTKRVLGLLLVAAMLMSGFAIAQETQTATGTSKGYGGDVTVTLTVTDNKLTEVSAQGAQETANVGTVALSELPEKMLRTNSVDVDIVAGATVTSNAVIAAAKAALAAAGIQETALAPLADEAATQAESMTADVIVIGGGGAGLAAGIAATDESKTVIVLERLAVLGGNTALSGGVITRAGIPGDPEGTMSADELYDYYMKETGGKPDPDVVRTYVDQSADTMAWAHSQGSGVAETTRYRVTPETIMSLQPATDRGYGLINPMAEGLRAAGGQILMNTLATDLIVEDGKVIGVKAINADGQQQEFYANGGVVIATGGFPASTELLKKYSSIGAERATPLCSVGTDGSGLVMAEAIGADVKFGDDWDSIGTNSELTAPYKEAFPQLVALMVNDSGNRFLSEDAQRPTIYKTMLHQLAEGANGFFFLFDKNTIGTGVEAFIEEGSAFQADSIEELADQIGVPADALLTTVARYNEQKGQDDADFNKPAKFMLGLSEAPFYAAKTWPVRTSTIGGLVTDVDAHVLDTQGQPIPGLFAAGEVANYSFFHSVYATCGSAVGHAIIYGRIAGTNAAKLVD